jgi:cyanophycinase
MLGLVGSGEYLPPIASVDRELIRRLAAPMRVVCLPTAAGTEGHERIEYWSRLGVDHFTGLGVQAQALAVIDRASADDPALAAVVAQANFVYLSGGKPDYLHRTLDGSLVWKAISERTARPRSAWPTRVCLERQRAGVIFAGITPACAVLRR